MAGCEGKELSLNQGKGNFAETRCWHQQAGLSRNGDSAS